MRSRVEFEALVAQVEAMASSVEGAEAILASLSGALFPGGLPGLDRTTWSDQEAADVRGDVAVTPEARLKAVEARFRTLVEQIPAVTFMAVLGEGLNEIYVSPHVEQMLGYTQQEWLADPFLWYNRLHSEDRRLWNEEFARGCRTGGPFRAECRFLARDGHTVWVHGEARVVRDERGRPMFLQGVAFDITESKRAQEIVLGQAVQAAKMAEELEIARRVQTSLVPRDIGAEGLEMAARMIAASDVGGDYYDVLRADDGCWIAIGDVSGHGLNAGLVMLMVQSAMTSLVRAAPTATPADLVCMLNEVLYDNVRTRLRHDDHVTFTLLRYRQDGSVTFAGAHEDILVWRSTERRIEAIRPPGTWIGARRDVRAAMTNGTLQLRDGDVMVLYTDGVTEARDAEGRFFDIDRLAVAMERRASEPVGALRDGILAEVSAWMARQEDDMTLLVARYRAPPPVAPT